MEDYSVEKEVDRMPVKIMVNAARAGALLGAVYGWFEGYHGDINGFRGAAAGFGYGYIGAGGVAACLTSVKNLREAVGGLTENFILQADEPMPQPLSYEGPTDRLIDGLLELVRVDPA